MIQFDMKIGAPVREIDSDMQRPLVTDKPLPTAVLDAEQQYYSFRDQHGNVPYWPDESCEWVVKDKQIKVTAYNKQTKQSKEFDDESLVTDDYTLLKPEPFQKWDEDKWVQDDDAVAQYNAQNGKVIRDNAISSNLSALDATWQVLNDAADIRRVINDAETIEATETDTTQFRLADNTWRETSLAELREVLRVFIARKRDIWTQFAQWDATDKLTAFSPEI